MKPSLVQLQSLVSGSFWVAASLLAKSAVLVGVGIYAYDSLQGSDVSRFFQLVFIQSIIISVVSAAGYFSTIERADGVRDVRVITGHVGVALLVAAMSVIAAFVYFEGFERDMFMLVSLGALATGVTAPFYGVSCRVCGFRGTYLPQICLAVLSALFLILLAAATGDGDGSAHMPYLFLVGFQLAAAVLVVVRVVPSLSIFVEGTLRARPADYSGFSRVLVYGVLNAGTVLGIFVAREIWSGNVAVAYSATVFLLLRIADSGLQVLSMVWAAVPGSIDWVVRWRRRIFVAILAGLAASLSGLGILTLGGAPIFVTFVISQALLELVRVPATSAFVLQMTRGTSLSYAGYVVAALASGAGVSLVWPALLRHEFGLFVLMAVMAASGGLVTMIALGRYPKKLQKNGDLPIKSSPGGDVV